MERCIYEFANAVTPWSTRPGTEVINGRDEGGKGERTSFSVGSAGGFHVRNDVLNVAGCYESDRYSSLGGMSAVASVSISRISMSAM